MPLMRVTLEERNMRKQPSKTVEVLRWLAVLPGGVLAGLLVLFPLHWVLYGTLVKGGMVQMPVEDLVPIERFLSPVISSIFFVYAGALIAPKRQVLVSYVLFSLSLFARIGILLVATAKQLDVDLSAYGILRIVLSSMAGALGILMVTLKTRQNRDSL